MADVFISFKTTDTPRVRPIRDGFLARGLSVFWSNDIPKGAPDYQAIIIREMEIAPLVVVVWTFDSVSSHPVRQECAQAQHDDKLIQLVLDQVRPIEFPMEANFGAQKTVLIGWTGDQRHAEWVAINTAIDTRLGRRPGAIPVEVGMPGRSQRKYYLPGSGKTEWFRDHEHGPEMVVVPAGSFQMGSPESDFGRWSKEELGKYEFLGAEGPQQTIEIKEPFAVGRHAVTRGQFAAFAAATGHKMDGGANTLQGDMFKHDPNASWRNPGFAQDDSHPVVCVNWPDATAYAAWLAKTTGKDYRLLSEAQWEFAARAIDTASAPQPPFWWGDTITTEQANYDGNHTYGQHGQKGLFRKTTLPVGSFAANPWGLFQVHGNVWEWCEDVFNKTLDGVPSDGSPRLQGTDASRRVVRGGSWNDYPRYLRSAIRSWNPTRVRLTNSGFRVGRLVVSPSSFAVRVHDFTESWSAHRSVQGCS